MGGKLKLKTSQRATIEHEGHEVATVSIEPAGRGFELNVTYLSDTPKEYCITVKYTREKNNGSL